MLVKVYYANICWVVNSPNLYPKQGRKELADYRLWLGNGDHPDIPNWEGECQGCPPVFPTERAKTISPPGAEFVTAVSTSPRPGSDIRDGFFISPSSSKKWKWVLWDFTYDDNYEVWSWLIRATSDQPFATSAEAAAYLLDAVWFWERDKWGTTLFEQVEDLGLIPEGEVWKIGETAFGAKER